MIESYKLLSLKWYKWYRLSDWMIIIEIVSFVASFTIVTKTIIIDNEILLSDRMISLFITDRHW